MTSAQHTSLDAHRAARRITGIDPDASFPIGTSKLEIGAPSTKGGLYVQVSTKVGPNRYVHVGFDVAETEDHIIKIDVMTPPRYDGSNSPRRRTRIEELAPSNTLSARYEKIREHLDTPHRDSVVKKLSKGDEDLIRGAIDCMRADGRIGFIKVIQGAERFLADFSHGNHFATLSRSNPSIVSTR